MPLVSDFISFLQEVAPLELAEEWDNVGLLLGRADQQVNRVLTCLTLTPEVAAEAISSGVQLVVAHHPLLFSGAKKITDADPEGRVLLDLIENRIAVYSAHTAFDSAATGINQWLAERFGLVDIRPLRESEKIAGAGAARVGTLAEPHSLKKFLSIVRQAVGAPYAEYSGNKDSMVRKVAVACGSAAEFLSEALELGCDTFVTGEARYHTALAARAQNINLILTGHHSSERPAMEALAELLESQFEIEVCASKLEIDPLNVDGE